MLGLDGSRADDIQRTLHNIQAVACYVLNLDATFASDLFVGVQPLNGGWKAKVEYSGFQLVESAETLEGVLYNLLVRLMKSATTRIEEGTRVLSAIGSR